LSDKYVITGEYGSGKTEFALNFALRERRRSQRPLALVDLDIVNPYFRSRDVTEVLEREGIEVVYSRRVGFADLPALSPRTDALLRGPVKVILDVGGDDGAVVLGRYKGLLAGKAEVWQVVNCFRPFTSTSAGIIEAGERILAKSGLTITGLVNNSNLGRETSAQEVRHGAKIVAEAAAILGVPILYNCARPELLGELADLENLISMDLSLFPDYIS
jgi:hypothetical protein